MKPKEIAERLVAFAHREGLRSSVDTIATALRAAEARGYERAREQAAGVIETQCHDDMTRDEEARAIRAMQPEDVQ